MEASGSGMLTKEMVTHAAHLYRGVLPISQHLHPRRRFCDDVKVGLMQVELWALLKFFYHRKHNTVMRQPPMSHRLLIKLLLTSNFHSACSLSVRRTSVEGVKGETKGRLCTCIPHLVKILGGVDLSRPALIPCWRLTCKSAHNENFEILALCKKIRPK